MAISMKMKDWFLKMNLTVRLACLILEKGINSVMILLMGK